MMTGLELLLVERHSAPPNGSRIELQQRLLFLRLLIINMNRVLLLHYPRPYTLLFLTNIFELQHGGQKVRGEVVGALNGNERGQMVDGDNINAS